MQDITLVRATNRPIRNEPLLTRAQQAPVTFEELKKIRDLPEWETNHGITEWILCRECGESHRRIDTYNHLPKHDMHVDLYRARWPGAPTVAVYRLQRNAELAREFRATHPKKRISPAALSEKNRNAARAGWEHRPRVKGSELEDFRSNPQLEGERRITEYVVCRECGVQVRRLDRACSHLRLMHVMTTSDYKRKWPGVPLRSTLAKKRQLQNYAGWYSVNKDHVKGYARKKRELNRAELAKLRAIVAERAAESETPVERIGKLVQELIPIFQRFFDGKQALPSKEHQSAAKKASPTRPLSNRSTVAARYYVVDTQGFEYSTISEYHKRFVRQRGAEI